MEQHRPPFADTAAARKHCRRRPEIDATARACPACARPAAGARLLAHPPASKPVGQLARQTDSAGARSPQAGRMGSAAGAPGRRRGRRLRASSVGERALCSRARSPMLDGRNYCHCFRRCFNSPSALPPPPPPQTCQALALELGIELGIAIQVGRPSRPAIRRESKGQLARSLGRHWRSLARLQWKRLELYLALKIYSISSSLSARLPSSRARDASSSSAAAKGKRSSGAIWLVRAALQRRRPWSRRPALIRRLARSHGRQPASQPVAL